MNIQAFIGFGFTLSVVEIHVDQVGLRADPRTHPRRGRSR